jgi:hypothetical protein
MPNVVRWKTARRAAAWLVAEVADDGWSSGPRPPARATVRSSGPTPFRALLVGGGPAVGYGVTTHDLSLAGHLARELTAASGSGLDMDVLTGVDLRCRDMPDLLGSVDVTGYDMLLLSVGVQDVLDFTHPDFWVKEARHVLEILTATGERGAPLFVIGVPPVSRMLRLEPHVAAELDRRAGLFNDQLVALCSASPRALFVPFAPEEDSSGDRHRTSGTYRSWAERIALNIAPVVRGLGHCAKPNLREDARQAALERLNILDTPREQSFDSITATARRFFATAGAGISFIDGDRQWFKSSSGIDVTELPRAVGLCHYAIQTIDGFVVEDLTADVRFADNELVTNANLRSYAGVPIRDPSGHAVGALCVFDDKCRTFTVDQLVFLRDLAHLAEQQLQFAA